ncbi:hypothetical protein [Candidatus Uabimicrobium sp. HlEnr_7]|uniref:hypothetical protein n=1 Tax=Candidatus Uabimicrobium helgolandensis TaxID=3095367 RepID=UPI0035578B98
MSKKNYTPLLFSIISGAVAFTIASLLVFATVAFAERQLYQTLGMLGAYVFWVILFIGSGAILLHRLVRRVMSLQRFATVYAISFSLYSTAWITSYFFMRSNTGEWVGSATGSLSLSITLAIAFHMPQKIVSWSLFFFITHSLGYFSGSYIFEILHNSKGMILWGITYGLGTGAGLGFILYDVKEKLVNVKSQ